MFNYDMTLTDLENELLDKGYDAVKHVNAGPASTGQLMLVNYGNQDITITVAGASVKDSKEFTNQNPAITTIAGGAIQTKLARISKLSTMQMDLSLSSLDVGLTSELIMPSVHYELSYVEGESNLKVKINKGAQRGLIPIFFTDIAYQIDQLEQVTSNSVDVLTIGNTTYNFERVRKNLFDIEVKPGSKTLVLYIAVEKNGTTYSINPTPLESEYDGEIFLPLSGDMQIHWDGKTATAPDANYLPSNLQSFNLVLDVPTEISCDGAMDFLGELTLNDEVSGLITTPNDSIPYTNTNQLMTSLTQLGYSVSELSRWEVTPLYPRAAVRMDDSSLLTGRESNILSITLTRDGELPVTYTGDINDVLYNCQQMGIVIEHRTDTLHVGTLPGTPKTNVKVTLVDDWTIWNTDYLIEELEDPYYNPSVTYPTPSAAQFDVKWDNSLVECWCFIYSYLPNNGEAGQTLVAPVDISTVAEFTTAEKTVILTEDYTEMCNHAPDFGACMVSEQRAEFMRIFNARVVGRGGKYMMYRQFSIWTPEATDETGTLQSSQYTPVAVPWTYGNRDWGYGIPEPIIMT